MLDQRKMVGTFVLVIYVLLLVLGSGCKRQSKVQKATDTVEIVDHKTTLITDKPEHIPIPEGMVWIPGGVFYQGADTSDRLAMHHERPRHQVAVDGFFMDITEVTNAQFAEFVEATAYITVAERKLDWEEMKQQLPPGTPKPADSVFQPGSLIFKKPSSKVTDLANFTQWWEWKVSANWRRPSGSESSIEGLNDHPVVHIAYEDALAYCQWKGHRLPTEAEWEYASKSGQQDSVYPSEAQKISEIANTWDGNFPETNTLEDGFEKTAPVKSFPPNSFGLYDMAGNVWEWTQDWYDPNYYKELASGSGIPKNPIGPEAPYNPHAPFEKAKVIKGGSFLCNANYCASYRPSAKMHNALDSSQEHMGFRTVKYP